MRILAKISDREIIESGSILVSSGQELSIYPFEDDANFSIDIDLEILDDEQGRGRFDYLVDTQRNLLKIVTPFRNDATSVNREGINIASDEYFEYWLRIGYHLVGKRERFSCILYYNLLRARKRQ